MMINTANWKTYEFGDLARNLTVAVKDPLSEGYKRYVGLEHIEPSNMHIKAWGNVAAGTTFTRVFKKDQVLFGKRRAYQRKAALAEFDGICSGDILVFEANTDSCLPKLLPFIVQSNKFFDYAIKTSAGSLSPRTKFKDLAKLKFKLPSLTEQKRLANLLGSVDGAAEAYRRLIYELKKGFHVILEGSIKKPILSSAPLGDFVKIGKGLTYTSDDYGDKASGNMLINLKCFEKFGGFNKEGIKFYSGAYSDKHILRKNDLIIANTDITRNGDVVGFPVLVPDFDDEIVLFTMDVSRMEIKDTKCMLGAYLFYLLRTQWAHWYMYAHSPGTTVLHLDLSSVPKLSIPNISIDEQECIVNKLKTIENNVQKYKDLVAIVEQCQKQMINQIFGGAC
ncbi:MAG: restriction endonuclease subunit S [Candidatus Saelkia tenebricola]|nr:restriction endonuclease subunit S [Candidatus Saelkia tenebricola]